MKNFIKLFSALFLFSFFSFGWVDFDDEKSRVDCLVDAGPDVISVFWDSYQVNAVINRPLSEVEEITWSSAENLSCSDCLNPVVTTGEDLCLSLTVKFNDGCIASDEICIFIDGCNETVYENKINSITPQSITDDAEIELEIERTQFVHFEIVENDEILYTIKEGWIGRGLQTMNLDFSQVPAGNHQLRVRLYPENKFISITKL